MVTLRLAPVSGAPIEITKDSVLIGRDPTADVVVADGSVSRKHARIERRGLAWAVVDQGSANGTFLDSHRVDDAALRNGQELRIGAVPFRVELDSTADTGATLGDVPESEGATVVQAAPLAPPPAPPPMGPPTATIAPLPASAPPAPPPRAAAPPPLPPSPGASPRPPQMSVSGPPAKQGKGPVFWVVMGCGGCLTMLFLFFAVIGGLFYVSMKGPVDTVEAEIASLRSGALDEAYGRLSDDYKNRVSREAFATLVGEHPSLKDNVEASFWPPAGAVHIMNDQAQVSGQLVSRSGVKEQVAFELVKEGGGWKISALRVEGGS